MDEIAESLKSLGDVKIAIVSIMGAYRTGKSFLLDLFLRYLRDKESKSTVSSVDIKKSIDSFSDEVPSWLVAEGPQVKEGHGEGVSGGFQWRGGMEKCTQGVWIWSHPFVVTGVDGDRVAILLLDSQGAFDSQMTKEQSATIFGLTAVLSSFQIYNLSMQIQEDKIESLHYFMECASSCMRFLNPEGEPETDLALFQRLEFLVRDWPNFEPGWSLDECKAQMAAHLSQHLDGAKDSTTPEALKKMFSKITCWMLPHPGLKINKAKWTGDIADLDLEFIKFLNQYVSSTFANIVPREIFSKPLTPSSFADVMEMFTLAFQNLVPKGANLAIAIANSSNLMSKEKALNDFKANLEKSVEKSNGLEDSEFAKMEARVRQEVLETFAKGTTFGPPESRTTVRSELVAELDNLKEFFFEENRRKLQQALNVFAGFIVLIFALYAIDKLSDFTCDWYSETCVRMSNALFLIYFTLIVAILTNAYFLLQAKGKTVAVLALMELGKTAFALFLSYAKSIKDICVDIRTANSQALTAEAQKLGSKFLSELQSGYLALTQTFRDIVKANTQKHTPGRDKKE